MLSALSLLQLVLQGLGELGYDFDYFSAFHASNNDILPVLSASFLMQLLFLGSRVGDVGSFHSAAIFMCYCAA